MCIDAADEHAVLLDEPESGRCLSRTGNDTVVPYGPCEVLDPLGSREVGVQ